MKKYTVEMSKSARTDLKGIAKYIATTDSVNRARYVLDKINEAVNRLHEAPERGVVPKDLLKLGKNEYREIFFKPYRIIYRIDGNKVRIFVIADGRRNMQELLASRLLNVSDL